MSTRLKKTLSIIFMCLIVVGMIPATPSFAQSPSSQWTFNYSGNIVTWTVPFSGTYRIEVWGAQGGSSSRRDGGLGARMRGDFDFTAGTTLKILVGQKGEDGNAGGGGGGTFVVLHNNEPLIIAAGGGGADRSDPGGEGRATTSGSGEGGGNYTYGGGGGGGGLLGDGSYNDRNGEGGRAFINGGRGGKSKGSSYGDGGFGGGGGAGYHSTSTTSYNGGGGGGGYTGGAGRGSSSGRPGYGGYSFNAGYNQSNSSGVREGNGYTTITLLSITNSPTIISPVPGSKYLEPKLSATLPTMPLTEYQWQYSINSTTFYNITTTTSLEYKWEIPDTIPDDTSIYLRVRAKVGTIYGPWSEQVVFTKGLDDLLGARLAAEHAAQMAAEGRLAAREAKEEVRSISADVEQMRNKLLTMEVQMQKLAMNNIQLYWEQNKTATRNQEEWLNVSEIGPGFEFRYRVNNDAYSNWSPLFNGAHIELGPSNGYKLVNVQIGTNNTPLVERWIGIWKLK